MQPHTHSTHTTHTHTLYVDDDVDRRQLIIYTAENRLWQTNIDCGFAYRARIQLNIYIYIKVECKNYDHMIAFGAVLFVFAYSVDPLWAERAISIARNHLCGRNHPQYKYIVTCGTMSKYIYIYVFNAYVDMYGSVCVCMYIYMIKLLWFVFTLK